MFFFKSYFLSAFEHVIVGLVDNSRYVVAIYRRRRSREYFYNQTRACYYF